MTDPTDAHPDRTQGRTGEGDNERPKLLKAAFALARGGAGRGRVARAIELVGWLSLGAYSLRQSAVWFSGESDLLTVLSVRFAAVRGSVVLLIAAAMMWLAPRFAVLITDSGLRRAWEIRHQQAIVFAVVAFVGGWLYAIRPHAVIAAIGSAASLVTLAMLFWSGCVLIVDAVDGLRRLIRGLGDQA